ncbi:hypothetical protein [Vannielia litorea]|uniref:Uncharacterized protein n=1 Tax=Vannielia litorea TaxID=1217970 RepID=A0A1N6FNJ6_9RHOB|nr:hypothetical protein [Vannielia litorea]SIN96821.1 hypothetical protein SAMN05444002_1818 [Vannielia litorea]
MGDFFTAIWRSIARQFRYKAEHTVNTAVSRGIRSATDKATRKSKDG